MKHVECRLISIEVSTTAYDRMNLGSNPCQNTFDLSGVYVHLAYSGVQRYHLLYPIQYAVYVRMYCESAEEFIVYSDNAKLEHPRTEGGRYVYSIAINAGGEPTPTLERLGVWLCLVSSAKTARVFGLGAGGCPACTHRCARSSARSDAQCGECYAFASVCSRSAFTWSSMMSQSPNGSSGLALASMRS